MDRMEERRVAARTIGQRSVGTKRGSFAQHCLSLQLPTVGSALAESGALRRVGPQRGGSNGSCSSARGVTEAVKRVRL